MEEVMSGFPAPDKRIRFFFVKGRDTQPVNGGIAF
jgi:hypothetical protein